MAKAAYGVTKKELKKVQQNQIVTTKTVINVLSFKERLFLTAIGVISLLNIILILSVKH